LIRASHAKPWAKSSDAERLDPDNGLPLIATLDAAFDSGLVSFGDDGSLLFAADLGSNPCAILGLLPGARLLQPLSAEQRAYMRVHREEVFGRPGYCGTA